MGKTKAKPRSTVSTSTSPRAKAGWLRPVMQVRPVIKKRSVQLRDGRDLVRGITANQKQKGVQCQRRIKGLSQEGTIQAPYEAKTIMNYETTTDNAFVREGLCTPDDVYDMLMDHPARQREMRDTRTGRTTTRPGYFVLVPYVPELTEEEEILAHSGPQSFSEEVTSRQSTVRPGVASIPQDVLNMDPDAPPVNGIHVQPPVSVGEEAEIVV